jgi:DNA helicase-2/ATP-dependent DNA helicase PcrA
VEVEVSQGLYGGGAREDTGFAGIYAESGVAPTRPSGPRRGPRTHPRITDEDAAPKGGEGALAKGTRVFHQKFGYGKIVSVEGDKLQIAFEKAGRKKVMAGFVEPV